MTEANAPRPDKAETVKEIAAKLTAANAVFVTEYRGMSVGQLADLRSPLRAVGAEHKVYKNTLAKLAAVSAGLDGLTEHLTGPTALTFAADDSVGAAKALVDTAKANPMLVIKGGMLGEVPMSADDVKALASLPSREELLASFAGALEAPLAKTARLLNAMPNKLAFGLSALIEKQEAAA
jgi:large subunit ribosomal protein L10